MTPARYAAAYRRILAAVDFGKSHGSCGVWIFKLRKVYWANPAAVLHDHLYAEIDWSVGSELADLIFYDELIKLADTQDKLDEAAVLYGIARKWGQARFGLAKLGIVY